MSIFKTVLVLVFLLAAFEVQADNALMPNQMEKLAPRPNQQCDEMEKEIEDSLHHLAAMGRVFIKMCSCPHGPAGNAAFSPFIDVQELLKCMEAGGQGEMSVTVTNPPCFPAPSPCKCADRKSSPLLLILAIVVFAGFILAAGGLAALIAHLHFQKK